tara:strand:- start:583 stop:1863 length:1281 start_codon:yes stop_codon:yes gene_type:complete
MSDPIHNIKPSEVFADSLSATRDDRLDKIKKKLIKQQNDIAMREKVALNFNFDKTWRRTKYLCYVEPDKPLNDFYLKQTFDNQKEFGNDIADTFRDRNVTHVLAIAPTQSGKTGSMIAISRAFNNSDSMKVDHNNIFVFTGHSSKEWTEQTKERFPPSMVHNIFHRNNIKHFVERLKHLNNVLIIFDESHIANKFGQTLYSIYMQLGFFNIPSLYKRNIKIVHFTATPDSILPHIDIWEDSLRVKYMKVPDSYISVDHYINRQQIFEVKPLLDCHDNIRQLLNHIDTSDPFFHIIRTHRGQNHIELIRDFKRVFSSHNFDFISEPHFHSTTHKDISSLFYNKPNLHTFVFIVDKLRCAKSIHTHNIQLLYDRFVLNPSRDSILQGLLGRCTGYHTHTKHLRFFTFSSILTQHQLLHNFTFSIFYPC